VLGAAGGLALFALIEKRYGGVGITRVERLKRFLKESSSLLPL